MMIIAAFTEALIYFLVKKLDTKNNWNHIFISYALSAIVGLTQEDDDAQTVSKSVEEKVPSLTVAKEFMNLCAEHNLDAQEFAKFHNIDSKHSETVTNGIANFNSLKEKFLNASNTITH